MKKMKILIPALGVLCFSAAAAVSGTVAWFTATSATTVSTSKFSITGLDGSLKVKAIKGVGTTVEDDPTEDPTVSAEEDSSLTHGSFDHASKTVYSKDQESTGFWKRGVVGTDAATAFQENASLKQYNCYTWQYEFLCGKSATEGYDDYVRNLYFDVSTAVSKISLWDATSGSAVTLSSTAANSGRAFRIAFLSSDTNAKPLVWSPLTAKTYAPAGTSPINTKYVNSTTTTKEYAVSAITDNLFYQGDGTVSKISSGSKGIKARKDYLGSFDDTHPVITVTCVAWFEGCDEININNSVTYKPNVSADIGFYIRENKAS